jgi:hypothetical protein
MPEAPVNEDHAPVFRQDNIRLSGQLRHLEAKAKSELVKLLPNRHFDARVSPSDARHDLASLLGTETVRHRLRRYPAPSMNVSGVFCPRAA